MLLQLISILKRNPMRPRGNWFFRCCDYIVLACCATPYVILAFTKYIFKLITKFF
ncbi:unnamed protein product [Meloidogyne enterolobii]|uniref:Uncharacterized protein n=1 Tax=Meloidogyne enterolobii TaxID=390850 RepID=A0ACB0Z3D9_MELEN